MVSDECGIMNVSAAWARLTAERGIPPARHSDWSELVWTCSGPDTTGGLHNNVVTETCSDMSPHHVTAPMSWHLHALQLNLNIL